MKLEYKCSICNNNFKNNSALTAHIFQKHNLFSKEYYDKYLKKPDEGFCKTCGKPTRYTRLSTGYKNFCSIQCSRQSDEVLNNIRMGMKNSEHWQKVSKSKEFKKKLSESIKNSDYIKNVVHTEEYKNRQSKILKQSEKFKESRSSKNYRTKISLIASKRAKEGKAKAFYKYNEILFASKWELAYYIWLKDNNINFKYQLDTIEYEFEGIKKHYVPDFEVNGVIQEIKGLQFFDNHDPSKRMINPYRRKIDSPEIVKRRDNLMEAKHQCMIRNNVEIITDCSKYIEYVETKYGKAFFEEHKIKNSLLYLPIGLGVTT